MEVLKNLVILLIGFVLLIKGADYFVEGSSSVARRFKIPSIVVGLTIVAMGTSLPELSVSVSAALNGSNAIAVSNVVGSNIFNILVVLGACALFAKMPVNKSTLKREFPFLIIISVIVTVMIIDNKLPWAGSTDMGVGTIARFDAAILLALFISFLAITVKMALRGRQETIKEEKKEQGKEISLVTSLIFIVCGIIAIKFGGDFVVSGAKNIAISFGMSETLVGLTIVAIGTSLPELVTSLVAARKGETELAVGNVVGSNIFNLIFILGLSSMMHPIVVEMQGLIDILVMIVITIVSFYFGITKKFYSKKEGAVMVAMYAAYMVYAIVR